MEIKSLFSLETKQNSTKFLMEQKKTPLKIKEIYSPSTSKVGKQIKVFHTDLKDSLCKQCYMNPAKTVNSMTASLILKYK